MMIRPKTKRRLLILLGGLVLFSCAAGWLYAYRMRIAESKLQLDRQVGMDAYKSGDYQTAVDKLAEYINHEQQREGSQLAPRSAAGVRQRASQSADFKRRLHRAVHSRVAELLRIGAGGQAGARPSAGDGDALLHLRPRCAGAGQRHSAERSE